MSPFHRIRRILLEFLALSLPLISSAEAPAGHGVVMDIVANAATGNLPGMVADEDNAAGVTIRDLAFTMNRVTAPKTASPIC